jgi:murein DD-endopeptidase MepM/ murein hydrolase activator NlpD
MRVLIIVLLVVVLGAAVWRVRQRWESGPELVATAPSLPVSRISAFRKVVLPTDQQGLLDEPRAGVFQPTGSGNVQSALYGSVRTVQSGKGLASSFHEGVDIAPVHRDARGLPLDKVYAVASGKVGYVNRQPGNSNYGNYVVLLHEDPVGEVYTLYAHLAAVESSLQSGVAVMSGAELGRMGHTPVSIIPVERAHLHFEVGLLVNARFGEWFRGQRLKPDHGNFNGQNLLALNPLEFLKSQRGHEEFEFGDFLKAVPVAFEVLVPMVRPCDYFRRYPGLWEGTAETAGWAVLSCSENGTPLKGRAATAAETLKARGRKPVVLSVNAEVLGRNGCHLIQHEGTGWRAGAKGARWLEILTYP